ncbi:hypothetical protein [Shewanella pneumatophori]|uniref:Uncharacterized protein n=1 Tax=Shewanella pneumatophori TaxID=314092 RepID=A0A9X1ZL29_9GAMM|nr:hypothetical protein [Shewanella pneumatophori]MCL1137946.1 hypothetical protein [Shewanella pneumatophori]
MPKIRIQHFTKTNSLIGDPVFIESEYVPRVGELLDSGHLYEQELNNIFIVTGVVHRVTSEGLMPCITAKNWYKGLRAELLEEFGWLPQTMDTNFGYDEDFYYD